MAKVAKFEAAVAKELPSLLAKESALKTKST